MGIFILISILIVALVFAAKKVFYLAKRNLFKDQAAWSAKDIKIKYSNSKEIPESKTNNNYLKLIADESEIYLEEQAKRGGPEGK